MAYHRRGLSANYVPGGVDDYWPPAQAPELVAPEPQRIAHELPDQISEGIKHMDFNDRTSTASIRPDDMPHFSPFPKLLNPSSNVPQSDGDLEATLENARPLVLSSNDPEMQLAWAQDALIYCGVCADNEERIAATKPAAARASTPRVEHQLKTDSMNIVSFLADQHHPKAEFLKGMWLEWGRFGQREDKKEAFRCYSRAADKGYARAEYRIGMLYESYNDPIKALRHYNRGVDAGDAASCYRLGMMTLRGQNGQEQDFLKGVSLIKKSAETADENAAQGAYVYGMLLAKELPQIDIPDSFLTYDEKLAKQMIEKAAYLKFAKAQLKMGSAYELGALGCEFNPALSIHYNALASKQGEPEADMALSKWFLVGSEGLFAKNEEYAYLYAERAASSGLPTGEFAMGYFNEIGMRVPVNLEKAFEWYQKAADHGNEDAQGRIEGLRNKQVLNKRDHEQVAINRIKSQYGSQRGQRPAWLQQKAQSHMASIEESAGGYSNGSRTPMPQRGTTPYPEDDGPPKIATPSLRAQTTTPYPDHDGPPSIPGVTAPAGPIGGFWSAPGQVPASAPRPATTVNPQLRPSSAFQINPEIRSNSTQSLPTLSPPLQGRPYPSQQQPGYSSTPRPATTVQPLDLRGRLAGQRVASSGAGYGTSPLPSQGSFTPRPQPPPHQQTAPAGPPTQQRLLPSVTPTPPAGTKVDIGFSAPTEDRKSKNYYQAIQNPQPPVQPPDHVQARLPASMTAPTAGNGRVSARPANSRTPRPQQDGGRGNVPTAGGAPVGGKPAPTPDMSNVAGTVASNPATVSPAPTPASKPIVPPGKGPKTFDEMGVPKTKDSQDCVVM
ncbi:HCP-like protein [Polychaeton citri CBS 116435]|uniref:HCP-like protein n=1 Tax=Polychaeton citri CBS 116435 TaxID=1314669 RepID=A0A9P4Q2F1_9PEZI|nr:HCP-like protein [Polychaeton citri CBS 116435]